MRLRAVAARSQLMRRATTSSRAIRFLILAFSQVSCLCCLFKLYSSFILALNLNGMVKEGDGTGKKILPIGQGEDDLRLLQAIAASGWRGPIGILGHTQDDAEERLQDNLDGLAWLVRRWQGKPAGARPKPRTLRK